MPVKNVPEPWPAAPDRDAVQFVKDFMASGKPVGIDLPRPVDPGGSRRRAGPSPDVLARHPHRPAHRRRGRSSPDEEVVVDGQLVTSRSPADLPLFCAAVVEQFARAHHPVPS